MLIETFFTNHWCMHHAKQDGFRKFHVGRLSVRISNAKSKNHFAMARRSNSCPQNAFKKQKRLIKKLNTPTLEETTSEHDNCRPIPSGLSSRLRKQDDDDETEIKQEPIDELPHHVKIKQEPIDELPRQVKIKQEPIDERLSRSLPPPPPLFPIETLFSSSSPLRMNDNQYVNRRVDTNYKNLYFGPIINFATASDHRMYSDLLCRPEAKKPLLFITH